MVRRPEEWENWTHEQRMEWLRKQRTQYKGGRKRSLKENDKERVWSLMKKYGNKSMVADLLGVSRRTIIRFLQKYSIPKTFVVEESMSITDFPEIKLWLKRMMGFAKQRSINQYLGAIRKMYRYMKKHHPERAKPSLWTSDDITEFVYKQPAHSWHFYIVPLRSLALKGQAEFPQIDLGLLPTKKTHKAKKSLAGKAEYYLEPEQITAMIKSAIGMKEEKRNKALVAWIYNLAIRMTASRKTRIEDIKLDKHFARVKDKGDITWLVHGLTDRTCQLIREYLEERGWPKLGWLFVNGDGRQITSKEVNNVIKELGKRAGIEGKVLTSKVFRKSFAKNALEYMGMNPVSLIGTGKGTKTCFCVGWSDMKVLMEHYAPHLMKQIEEDRQKFLF